MRAYQRNIIDPTKYCNFGIYEDYTQSDLVDGFEWVFEDLPDNLEPYTQSDPINALAALIKQGESLLASNPLPEHIEKDILNLQVFVENYYRNNRISLVRSTILDFNVSVEDDGLTQDQVDILDGLKTQMLNLFPDV